MGVGGNVLSIVVLFGHSFLTAVTRASYKCWLLVEWAERHPTLSHTHTHARTRTHTRTHARTHTQARTCTHTHTYSLSR